MSSSVYRSALLASLVGLLIVVGNYTHGQSISTEVASPVVTQPQWQYLASSSAPAAAPAYVVFDVEDGTVLLAHNSDEVRPIASITKLLTAATVWQDSAAPNSAVAVVAADVVAPGVAGAVKVGEQYTPHELLFPLLLTSSNHAAATLERIKPDLLTDMNSYTDELGLAASELTDASGLSAGNVASAAELTRLTHHLYHTVPHIFDITRLERYLGPQGGWINNSPFVQDETYRGGKHGYTPAAGRTAVALFAEPFTAEERVLGYIVLGADSSAAAVTELRTHVRQTLDWQ